MVDLISVADRQLLQAHHVSIEIDEKDHCGVIIFNDRRLKVTFLTRPSGKNIDWESKQLEDDQMKKTASKVAAMMLKKKDELLKTQEEQSIGLTIHQKGFTDLNTEELIAHEDVNQQKNTRPDYDALMEYLATLDDKEVIKKKETSDEMITEVHEATDETHEAFNDNIDDLIDDDNPDSLSDNPDSLSDNEEPVNIGVTEEKRSNSHNLEEKDESPIEQQVLVLKPKRPLKLAFEKSSVSTKKKLRPSRRQLERESLSKISEEDDDNVEENRAGKKRRTRLNPVNAVSVIAGSSKDLMNPNREVVPPLPSSYAKSDVSSLFPAEFFDKGPVDIRKSGKNLAQMHQYQQTARACGLTYGNNFGLRERVSKTPDYGFPNSAFAKGFSRPATAPFFRTKLKKTEAEQGTPPLTSTVTAEQMLQL